ncbi:MAG: CpsD/CapB family tyrosine-protein kinase [Gammaproteobacteria bacterium]|nr:CpsD/CapB family tyrosine-protein kinase [Gammaproteobacteria bacterium]
MERIKQALERARAERAARVGAGSAAEQAEPAANAVSPGAGRSVRPDPRPVEVSWSSLYENRVVGGGASSPLVDSYRILRTRTLQRMAEIEARTLGITSANPGEGKSLTAVNLAISIAGTSPVLLVDTDLRRPSLSRLFGLEPSAGLAECLRGEAGFGDCTFSPGVENLTVLPGGTPTTSSSELLASSRMTELIQFIKHGAPETLLVFDLPPLMTTDDTLAVSPHLEAVLMVVEEGRTAVADLERARELLKGTRFLGSVLNKSTQPHQVYY